MSDYLKAVAKSVSSGRVPVVDTSQYPVPFSSCLKLITRHLKMLSLCGHYSDLKLPCISVADCTGFQHAWKVYLQCHSHMNLSAYIKERVESVVDSKTENLTALRIDKMNNRLLKYVWTEENGETTNRLQRKMQRTDENM
jgi:hypothetical protein